MSKSLIRANPGQPVSIQAGDILLATVTVVPLDEYRLGWRRLFRRVAPVLLDVNVAGDIHVLKLPAGTVARMKASDGDRGFFIK